MREGLFKKIFDPKMVFKKKPRPKNMARKPLCQNVVTIPLEESQTLSTVDIRFLELSREAGIFSR